MARYGRRDYDSAAPYADIPPDEPIFVIRGKDRAAPNTLQSYATWAQSMGASPELVQSVLDHARAMEDYQAAHGSKVPDLKA